MRTLLLASVLLVPVLAAAQPAAPDEDHPPARRPPLEPVPFALPAHHRLVLELELFADAAWTSRAGADLTQFKLDRGEAGATIGLGPRAGAELRLESIRSAGEGGALGVDGDSLVMRVKRAQVFGDLDAGPVVLAGAIGLVGDPWIAALEADDTLRPLTATASQRLLGWRPSDLALLARATAGAMRLSVTFGNGEGARYPERNDGKTTTAVFEIVPVLTRTSRLRVFAMGRDGSIGPARVRDHRLGGGATATTPLVTVGAEAVRAWGIADAGDVEAWAFGGWAEVRPMRKLALAAHSSTLRYKAGGNETIFGGAVAIEPWHDGQRGRLRLWLAAEHRTTSGAAMPLPGADAGTATTLMLLASTTAPFTLD